MLWAFGAMSLKKIKADMKIVAHSNVAVRIAGTCSLVGLAVVSIAFLPLVAWAHPFHFHAAGLGGSVAAASFATGFFHPFAGADHLALMLAVGLIASLFGGRVRVQLPLSFLVCLGLGLVCSVLGLQIASAEFGIALSLVVAGLVVARQPDLHFKFVLLLIAPFGFFHGLLHGTEIPASSFSTAIGFFCSTAFLQLIGVNAGDLLVRASRGPLRYARAAAGVALFAQGAMLFFA